MKKVFFVFRIVYLTVFVWFMFFSIVVNKAEAVVAPDYIEVEYIKAFRSVHEVNDILFVCRYDLSYVTEPTEFAGDSFLFAIVDSVGVIKVSRPLADDGYGHNIQTIYVTATEVGSLGITWGGNYSAVIMGNPTLFTVILLHSEPMSNNSWIPPLGVSTVLAGQANLKTGIIGQSRYLDGVDTTLLLTVSTSSGYKLTSAGTIFWRNRYSGVGEIADLSATTSEYMTVENQTYTGSYLTDLTTNSLFGGTATVKDAFTDLGDAIGIPYWQVIAFAVLCIPAFMIISGTVYGISGNSKLAAIVAAPVMFVISMLIPDALLMILTGIAAFVIVVVMWRFV